MATLPRLFTCRVCGTQEIMKTRRQRTCDGCRRVAEEQALDDLLDFFADVSISEEVEDEDEVEVEAWRLLSPDGKP